MVGFFVPQDCYTSSEFYCGEDKHQFTRVFEHHPFGFTMWMAGGGIRGGYVHGATDDFGRHAIHNKVHVHDLHATSLHLMGLNHTRLTYHFAGRDYRLTDVYGDVVQEILA